MNNTLNNQCTHQSPSPQNTAYRIETTAELLTLMNIYYSEWEHRDSLMWKQVFTFFFAVFVTILLPFSKIWDISLANVIPHIVFPITGIFLSFVFLYITIQYANRLSKIGETYRDMIELLPTEFQRKSLYSRTGISRRRQLAYVVPVIMFSALIVFATIVIILCLMA